MLDIQRIDDYGNGEPLTPFELGIQAYEALNAPREEPRQPINWDKQRRRKQRAKAKRERKELEPEKPQKKPQRKAPSSKKTAKEPVKASENPPTGICHAKPARIVAKIPFSQASTPSSAAICIPDSVIQRKKDMQDLLDSLHPLLEDEMFRYMKLTAFSALSSRRISFQMCENIISILLEKNEEAWRYAVMEFPSVNPFMQLASAIQSRFGGRIRA